MGAKTAEQILASMTLSEKIGQMILMEAKQENLDKVLELAGQGRLGAFLTYDWKFTSENGWKISEASRKSRVGVPVIYGKDVIHGHWTVYPIGLGLAAGFDPALAERIFGYTAKEASSDGVHWTFSPMMDIARDPRWGRVAEGFGEDPWLAARLAEACVRGLQGRDPDDLSKHDRILACAKHFIGYGAAEGGRDANTVEISAYTLLNTYFPAFHAAMKAGAGSIMSGYHDLNGEPVSGSAYIMDTLAKKIGGLDGFIVSDYGTTNQLCEYRFAENRKQATARAVNAGLDMDMGSGCFAEHLEELVKEGSVPISRIDDAVLRILRTKLRLDLWNRPLKAVTDKSTYSIPQEFKSAAVEAARKAAILLKNDGPILPLAKDLKKLAVIGPYTEATGELFGTWVLDGMAGFVTPVIKALRERMPGTEIKAVNSPFPDLMLWETKTFDDVVYLAGEHSSRSGERENLTSIGLPEGQEELILTLSRLGKRIILVVVAGRPLNLSRVLPHVAAVLYVFHPGTGGGEAIADILTGAGEPGGRLPMTFPRTEGQIPLYYNAFQERKNRPDHLRYIDMTEKPLFPFGYGLTYTDFRVSDIRIDKTEISLAGSVKVSVELANTGSREGEAVVQCYIQDCVASLIRPIRELKGCQRVKVGPNGVRRAEFVLGPDELGFYLPDGQWTVEPGTFKVFVGLDSRAELSAEFRVK